MPSAWQRAAFVEHLKQRAAAEYVKILSPRMQFIGKLRAIGGLCAESTVQAFDSTLVKAANGLSPRKLSQTGLMKRQKRKKYEDWNEHPVPREMIRFADAQNSQQDRADKNSGPEANKQQIAVRQLTNLLSHFRQSCLIGFTWFNECAARMYRCHRWIVRCHCLGLQHSLCSLICVT
jgi:hypothetical protein